MIDDLLRFVKAYGLAVEYADLGDWAGAELRSEYDPQGPVIRINRRIVERLPDGEADDFIEFAVAHELYHHREHRGEVPRVTDRAERERAANEFARGLLAGT